MQGFVELPFNATVFVSVSVFVFVFVLVSVFVSEMNEAEVCGLAVHRNWLPHAFTCNCSVCLSPRLLLKIFMSSKIVYLQSLNSHLKNNNLRKWSSCNCSVCLSSRLSLFKISLSFKIYILHSLNGHLKSNLIPKQNSPHMFISC